MFYHERAHNINTKYETILMFVPLPSPIFKHKAVISENPIIYNRIPERYFLLAS